MVQFVVPSLCLCLAAAFSPVQAKPRAELRSTRANGRAVASAAPALQATATALQGGAAASLGGGDERAPGGATALFLRYRTPLLFAALIVQKVAADSLTQYTRARGSYSGATVSMLSEVLKFPVLFGAVVAFGGGSKRIVPTVVGAVQQQPFKLAWIAGAYAAQNVLYFVALGHISAASYQVLSQSKLIFTAFLAVTLLKERLSWKQLGALGALLGGSLAVQFAEMSAGGAAAATMAGGAARNAAYGGVVTVIGALLSALPNVWYEKLLKTEGEDEWVRNFQVTTWIFGWIAASQFAEAVTAAGSLSAIASPGKALSALFGGTGLQGITPLVWVVIALKALNGILIPATLKYAGNLVYLYAKPTSIVLTALATAVYTRQPPAPTFVLGAGLVIASMFVFSNDKKKAD